MAYRAKPIPVRFWPKVDRSAEESECWLWKASVKNSGYGQFRAHGTMTGAHRVSYELANGPIPEGFEVDHTCRVKICVNPKHLRLATSKQNSENLAAESHGKSGVRNVHWVKAQQKWLVVVVHEGKRYYGGHHTEIDKAATAAVALRNKLYTYNTDDR